MPTSIVLNGRRISRPGVYADIRTNNAGSSATSVGGLALVGDFPLFEKGVPKRFFNASTLRDYDPASHDLNLWASLAFNPSSDDEVGGADSLWVVSTNTSTQAFVDVDDTNDAQALRIKSKVWGPAGNRASVKASLSGDEYTWTFARDGVSEEFKVSMADLGTVRYTAAVLATASLNWGSSNVVYSWTRLLGPKPAGPDAPLSINSNWDHCPAQGTLQVVLDAGAGAAHTADVTVTITGTTLAGAAQSEVLTFPQGTSDLTTVNTYGSYSLVVIDSSDNAWIGNATLTQASGKSIPVTGRKVSGVLAELGLLAGVDHEILDATARQINAADVDYTGTTDAKVLITLTAHTSELVKAFNASRLVEATRGSSGLKPDLTTAISLRLLGGTEASPVGTTDWQSALDAIVDQNVQHVVPLTADASVHALLAKHCNDAALQGKERDCWAGGAASETKAQFAARVTALNTRYVSLVGDRIKVNHPNGSQPWLDPMYLAFMGAAMQAGTSVGWPITHNRPRVVDVSQTWRPNLDAEELIRAGCTILTQDNAGWRFERVVTTHVEDDNIFKSEKSTWESLQGFVRFVRDYLPTGVRPQVEGYEVLLEARVAEAADAAVEAGIIKSWSNLVLVTVGDVTIPQMDVVPLFASNFTVLQITAIR